MKVNPFYQSAYVACAKKTNTGLLRIFPFMFFCPKRENSHAPNSNPSQQGESQKLYPHNCVTIHDRVHLKTTERILWKKLAELKKKIRAAHLDIRRCHKQVKFVTRTILSQRHASDLLFVSLDAFERSNDYQRKYHGHRNHTDEKMLPRVHFNANILYAIKQAATESRGADETAFQHIRRLRNEFKTLSDETKAIYEEQAAANRKTRALKRAELKRLRMTPYALFVQDQYRTVSMSIPGSEGPKKMSLVGKALSERWASLTAEERAVYRDRASAIRSAAIDHGSQ